MLMYAQFSVLTGDMCLIISIITSLIILEIKNQSYLYILETEP